MRVLLSTIGSRGDVQPLVALAVALQSAGSEVRLCVPPDFRDWIENLGFAVTTVGPELQKLTAARPSTSPLPASPDRLRKLAQDSVADQFEQVAVAAQGCDVIVAATALQIAARSIAERLGIGYVFAAFCPTVFPSPEHAPPSFSVSESALDNLELWDQDGRRFNETFGAVLNIQRQSLGLSPVDDVRSHVFGDQKWLAADATLGPWPDAEDATVVRTGAWIVQDERPLTPEIEAFLGAGAAPVYFGFGSIRAPHDLSRVMIETARALGRRAIVSRGWADLALLDEQPDCLAIGEVNQQALFRRVAAVVHHGGAGTTTAAALSGAPQVVIPQMYDQHYWARRVDDLGIGAAHAPGAPTTDSLTIALERALQADVAERARATSTRVRRDGAAIAARRLIDDARA